MRRAKHTRAADAATSARRLLSPIFLNLLLGEQARSTLWTIWLIISASTLDDDIVLPLSSKPLNWARDTVTQASSKRSSLIRAMTELLPAP